MNYSANSGFMPLSPLLCDSENANPFLKINSNTPSPNPLSKSGINPLDIGPVVFNEEKSGSIKSGSSSETDQPPKTLLDNGGPTIAVNKQEMAKLIEEQNLQKQRLLRKAEQARLSRKRKKMRMQELEKESEFLRAEVKRLKLALVAKENKMAAIASANKAFFPALSADSIEYAEMFTNLEESLYGGNQGDVKAQVEYMLRSFQSNKVDAEKYLEAFSNQISPSLPVRFLEWILNKKAEFYEDKSGLWNSLFSEETGLSKDQMKEMKKLRDSCSYNPFKKDEVMKKLGIHLKEQCEHQEKMLQKLSKILRPEQLAKFLLWVRKHGEVCIKIR